MHLLSHAVHSMFHSDRSRERLIHPGQSGFLEHAKQDIFLKRIGQVSSLIDQRSGAKLVLCDRRPLPEEGMVVVSQRLGTLGHKELSPVAHLVLCARMKGIVL